MRRNNEKLLATLDGIEPPLTESKSAVLPLNERALPIKYEKRKKPICKNLHFFHSTLIIKHLIAPLSRTLRLLQKNF